MKLTILGMNGPFPAPGSATSGYLLTTDDTAVALDMGAGTLSQLTARVAPEGLTALLLSHWHYDHCSDVLPLIFRLESLLSTGAAPLHVYAPADENALVRKAVQASPAIVLHDIAPGDVLTIGSLTISVYAGRHPVPALMYRVTDGTRTLCYTGDTNTTDDLVAFAQDADLLLADGLFPTASWAEGKPHLSAAHAAQLAQDAGVKKLIITHLNPFIDPETLRREARAIRSDSLLARIGDCYEI